MNEATDVAAAAQTWANHLAAEDAPALSEVPAPEQPSAAIAALAAEALARRRSLLVVVPDDDPLPDISNALDLGLRPLCLVLPGAHYVCRIALRATLSLLKSRLARGGEDSEGPAWAAQREHLAAREGLWQTCLAWGARNADQEPWPIGIEELFPVRILPLSMAWNLTAAADWALLLHPERMGEDAARAWPGATRTLLLRDFAHPLPSRALVPADETTRLRAELEVLSHELGELELELATAQAEIGDFTRRYHALVAGRMAELDRLRAEILAERARRSPPDDAEREAAEAARARAEQSSEEKARFADLERESPRAFAPTVDLKKLYRQIAQKIHPDRADDEGDRAWRTQLMSEANRAYRAGDEVGLREVMALWQEGGRRTRTEQGGEEAASRLMSEVDNLKRRVAEIEAELNRLYGSRLYELFAAANIARRQGRDLLQEMAENLDAQLAIAREELEALG